MRASGSSIGPMLGVVNLDKPVGVTSHDMVGLMRRLTGLRRIGHAGTLDPLASGVLPILVGPATRFSEELTGGRKRYDAVVRLGISSATDDAEGPLMPGSCSRILNRVDEHGETYADFLRRRVQPCNPQGPVAPTRRRSHACIARRPSTSRRARRAHKELAVAQAHARRDSVRAGRSCTQRVDLIHADDGFAVRAGTRTDRTVAAVFRARAGFGPGDWGRDSLRLRPAP